MLQPNDKNDQPTKQPVWTILALLLTFLLAVACQEKPNKANAVVSDVPPLANSEQILKKFTPNSDGLIKITWTTLQDVELNDCFNEQLEEYIWCPEFGDTVKALNGKEVYLSGYILPLEGDYFVLSANPMSSCFFCGGSGPQSILHLNFKTPRAFKMDDFLTFRGKFRLNKENIEELFYVFDEAEVYKKKK